MGTDRSISGAAVPGTLRAPSVAPSFRSWARRGYQRVLARAVRVEGEELRRTAVVFAPHPDDETLGCGGTILRKRAAGAAVTLVFMTDGASSHSRFLASDAMRAIRHQEALDAAAVLGIADADVVFLDFLSRGLWAQRDAAAARVAEILHRRDPGQIFLPYRHDAHTDHLATSAAVVAGARQWGGRVELYEYPIWFWRQWPWIPSPRSGLRAASWLVRGAARSVRLVREFRWAVDISDVLGRKEMALAQHRSQVSRGPDPAWRTLGDVDDGEFLRCFFQPLEIFRRSRP